MKCTLTCQWAMFVMLGLTPYIFLASDSRSPKYVAIFLDILEVKIPILKKRDVLAYSRGM